MKRVPLLGSSFSASFRCGLSSLPRPASSSSEEEEELQPELYMEWLKYLEPPERSLTCPSRIGEHYFNDSDLDLDLDLDLMRDSESPDDETSFSLFVGGLMTVPQLMCDLAFETIEGLFTFDLDLDLGLDLEACSLTSVGFTTPDSSFACVTTAVAICVGRER